MAGTKGHEAARAHLLERLESLGLEGYPASAFESPYSIGRLEAVNVIARLPGRDAGLAPVLLAAHYDTCGPFPGADDNAAAVAILLSVVESLRRCRLDRSVLFAFFDTEEPPFYLTSDMGSVRFYTEQRPEPIHCAIVMDLCGHDVPVQGLENLLFITGMESDPELGGVLRACEPTSALRTVPTLNRYIGDLSDHHIFRINRRPYLFLSCGRWAHYHQPTDTPEKLNYEKMAAIADYLVALTVEGSRCTLEGPFEEHDPVETELYFIRKAAGPFLGALGFDPQNRQDIDLMVQMLLSQFGL